MQNKLIFAQLLFFIWLCFGDFWSQYYSNSQGVLTAGVDKYFNSQHDPLSSGYWIAPQQSLAPAPLCDIHGQDLKALLGNEGCPVWHQFGITDICGRCCPMAILGCGLRHRITGAVCNRVWSCGMRVSTSKSEALVLSWKKVDFSHCVGTDRELSPKAKLLVYQSIYILTLTYGKDICVMTERMSRCKGLKWVFSLRVPGLNAKKLWHPRYFVVELLLLQKPVDVLGCFLDTSQWCSRHVRFLKRPPYLEDLEIPLDAP